jgi:hypothetical protein
MGCNCGKKQQVVLNPKPIVEEFNTEEIEGNILVPTPMTYDWYNNIDEIEPISGQTRN